MRDSPALHRAGIVFASDGTGGLIVKGFVPKSTAAQCGRILEGDLLVQVRAACSGVGFQYWTSALNNALTVLPGAYWVS